MWHLAHSGLARSVWLKKENHTTPVFSWADNRSRKYVDVLRKKFDETVIHNRTGARFHSSFWPAKLLDVLGRDLTLSTIREESMRGAVLLALATIGKIQITDLVSEAEKSQVMPNFDRHEAHKKARQNQAEIYRLLSK